MVEHPRSTGSLHTPVTDSLGARARRTLSHLGFSTFLCSDALDHSPLSHFPCSCGSLHPTSPAPRFSKTSRDTQLFAAKLLALLRQRAFSKPAAYTATNLCSALLRTIWAKTTNPKAST